MQKYQCFRCFLRDKHDSCGIYNKYRKLFWFLQQLSGYKLRSWIWTEKKEKSRLFHFASSFEDWRRKYHVGKLIDGSSSERDVARNYLRAEHRIAVNAR